MQDALEPDPAHGDRGVVSAMPALTIKPEFLGMTANHRGESSFHCTDGLSVKNVKNSRLALQICNKNVEWRRRF
jgi:hypothetical protein